MGGGALTAGDWGLGIGVQAQLTDYGRAGTYREGSGRRHVEVHMFNVARFVNALQALRECFDLLFWKNEPIIGWVVGKALMFMEFEKGRSLLEVTLSLVAALGLDFAELVQGLLELAGEAMGVQAESGQQRD
jgi:hypothetical protein